MQFIPYGPDIPERLLQAHEEGRVVFFCGAGISYPAGLPGFRELVEKIYAVLSPDPNAEQQAALNAGQFDNAIGLLEKSIIDGRKTIRQELARILLAPDKPDKTDTHHNMLTLGMDRDGQTRLVTTNFDRLFEKVIDEKSLTVERHKAPQLPVVDKHWNGLVYLHGLLGTSMIPSELNRLVVSRGDFGQAYLNEGRATRFVSELFRNYLVCFVGYSIDDPVLSYMVDAITQDHLLRESSLEIFAFGNYSQGEKEMGAIKWATKKVTPILYQDCNGHVYLHETLREWAEIYRDGVQGKEGIVDRYAGEDPSRSKTEDDFVGRMLWALSDPTGLPAKRFAERNPVPSLDWLGPLSDNRFRHADLDRFGVSSKAAIDEKLKFSLIQRPTPYHLAPHMGFFDMVIRGSRWDNIMARLAHWLTRHLGDPVLLLRLDKHGGQLHENLIWLIKRRLDELAEFEQNGDDLKLTNILRDAPKAIPGSLMRTLWRLVLTKRVKSWMQDFDIYIWRDRLRRDGLTTTLRMELREALALFVTLREPYSHLVGNEETFEPESIESLVNWEIKLSMNCPHLLQRELREEERWIAALPELLPDFSALLRDVLDLMRELGKADDRSDLSRMYQPSISEHPQNGNFRDWTVLIDLVREAWLVTAKQSPERASLSAETWWHTPYPLFRRLVFFAAAQPDIISSRRALDWLLADEGWWLWSVETQREVMRLLVALAPRLDDAMQAEVECAILAGPPRHMFKDDMKPERWEYVKDRDIWLRLIRLKDTQELKTSAGRDRLDTLSKKYPMWRIEPDERDEFTAWMQGPVWVGEDDERVVRTPRHRQDLVEWLRQHPDMEVWPSDDWHKRCRDNFATTACALYALSGGGEDFWPTDRWAAALQEWSKDRHIKRSWRHMGSVLVKAPESVLQELAREVGSWLQAVSKIIEVGDANFFALVHCVLDCRIDVSVDHDDPYTNAINHPVGCLIQALLNWWYRQAPRDGQGLPNEIKQTFTKICDTKIDKFRCGRVVLALHLIDLFRVDQNWTVQHLLPLFDWQNPQDEENVEAISAWGGFLWSRQLYPPLMEVASFKSAFLDTACHYEILKKGSEQYAAFLILVALDDPSGIFTIDELTKATHALPLEGLRDAAQALVMRMEGAGDQRPALWEDQITPYLRQIWPKTQDSLSPEISESFGLLCVASESEFSEALKLLDLWLQPLGRPEYVVHRLHKAGLCDKFPKEALEFLSRIIGIQTQWPPSNLGKCLEAILKAASELENDSRYKRLITYSRQYGMS